MLEGVPYKAVNTGAIGGLLFWALAAGVDRHREPA